MMFQGRCRRWAGLGLILGAMTLGLSAAPPSRPEDGNGLGIALENYPYPYPVRFMQMDWPATASATISGTISGAAPGASARAGSGGSPEAQQVRLAFMDIPPPGRYNGHTAVLLEDHDFPASYWVDVIHALSAQGWRVVVPDMIGFGKSAKPDGWTFDAATAALAQLLGKISAYNVDLIGHGVGGMLAGHFARAHPEQVRKLVLEAPLGLEDVQPALQPLTRDQMLRYEAALTPEAARFGMNAAFRPTAGPEWLQPYVDMRVRLGSSGEYLRWVTAYVDVSMAVLQHPMMQDWPRIATPTLFVVGMQDHDAPALNWVRASEREKVGHIADLALELAPRMPHASVETFDAGHLVHLEQPAAFNRAVSAFLLR